MTAEDHSRSFWVKLPIALRAVISGLLVALVASNVWPLLVLKFGVPLAAIAETLFLVLYVWWVSGGGSPRTTQAARASAFRHGSLSSSQWLWGLTAALFFAVTVHASVVLLFRFVPFPVAAFRKGYDLSFIPSPSLRWMAVVFSAVSAGYAKRPAFVATCSGRSNSATARRVQS